MLKIEQRRDKARDERDAERRRAAEQAMQADYDVCVPARNVIGQVGAGFPVLWDVLNPERIIAAAGGCGSSDAALDIAVNYAHERVVFNKPIGSNQAIQFPLAQTKAKVEPAHIGTSMLGLPKIY